MTTRTLRILASGLALLLVLGAPSIAAPDCTGISVVTGSDADFTGELSAVLIANGFTRPVAVTAPPGDTERVFVAETNGLIKVVKNGVVLPAPFLNLTALVPSGFGQSETGLLNMVFDPDYATNGFVYVYYTSLVGNVINVARYTVVDPANDDVADQNSAQTVITITNPASNHNGGGLAFRPSDGRLFVGTGDGGGACDTFNTGQSITTNLGKILRLDVSSLPYGTSGNPFDGPTVGNDEIWSFGIRNAFRISFDSMFNQIYIGDVGQNAREEIDCRKSNSPGGENYGWPIMEGDICATSCGASAAQCAAIADIPPIKAYLSTGKTVISGDVYRGCRMPSLHGTFYYADYQDHRIESFRTGPTCFVNTEITRTIDLAPGIATSISSFGLDGAGEVYMTDLNGGELFKIVPTLSLMEVGGTNAQQAIFDTDWSWENLTVTSGHPISSYKVYRSDNDPTGPFECVHSSTGATWIGGDPETPMPDETYFYLITARNLSGEETRPGNRSNGTARVVDTLSICP